MIRVQALDHIVLAVADVERSLRWYCERLGLAALRADDWRAGAVPFPSVRIDDSTIIDLIVADSAGADVVRNLDHFCLVVSAADLERVRSGGEFEIVRDPDFALFGARGMADGLYVRDPDGNEIELRAYSSL